MARGSATFTDLFGGEYNSSEASSSDKGRSSDCISRRNTRLLYRYYYYGTFTEKRYEIIITHLEAEFDLTNRTLTDLILANTTELRSIRDAAPDIKALKEMYPWLVW